MKRRLGTLGANLLRSFITDVSPSDRLTLAGTAMLVIVVVLLASAWPALRDVRVIHWSSCETREPVPQPRAPTLVPQCV